MTINLEMIKQLLDEFNEKEALTREEINIVEQEIKELEARIESSKSRLAHVAQDREKVAQMMDRYSGNSFFAATEFKGSDDAVSISKESSDSILTTKSSTDAIPVLKGSSDSIPVLKSSSDSIPLTSAADSLAKSSPKAATPSKADNSHGKTDVNPAVAAAPSLQSQPEPPANPFQSTPPISARREPAEPASVTAVAPVVQPVQQAPQPSSLPPMPEFPGPPPEPEPQPPVPVTASVETAAVTAVAAQGGTSPAHLPGFEQAQIPEPAPAVATPAVATQAEEAPQEEGEDDTVKSINDALRGLFR